MNKKIYFKFPQVSKSRIINFSAFFASSLVLFLLVFSSVYAQGQTKPPSALSLSGVIDTIITLFREYIIRLIFALAIVYFMWGVVQYMLYPDGESKDKGKQMMIWGIIALTVMFSMYGLIRIAMNTFGISENETIKSPNLPSSQ